MKLVLDTCSLLWMAGDPALLSPAAQVAVSANRHSLYVSAISAFEIGTKQAKGKLGLPMPADEWWSMAVDHYRLHVLDVTDAICLASTALPRIHADPCDRIIIATARGVGADVVTSDHLIRQYSEINVLW